MKDMKSMKKKRIKEALLSEHFLASAIARILHAPEVFIGRAFEEKYPGYLSSAGRKVTICGNIISSNMQMRYAGKK